MPILAAFAVPHPPIIMPEVGRGEEKKIRATTDAYREAMRRAGALRPDTVILTSPHAEMYSDYFHIAPGASAAGSLARFGAGSVRVEAGYDGEFVRALSEAAEDAGIPAGTLGERDAALDHASVIPLRFLDEFYSGYKLVRIGLSGLSPAEHYRFGRLIAGTVEKLGRRAVFIASGDLSHKLKPEGPYGFAREGPEFDAACTAALGSGDFPVPAAHTGGARRRRRGMRAALVLDNVRGAGRPGREKRAAVLRGPLRRGLRRGSVRRDGARRGTAFP
jgi:aromatic ring-opening dioxygenase LigB subunit